MRRRREGRVGRGESGREGVEGRVVEAREREWYIGCVRVSRNGVGRQWTSTCKPFNPLLFALQLGYLLAIPRGDPVSSEDDFEIEGLDFVVRAHQE